MTKQQFKITKRWLDKKLGKATEEAFSKGATPEQVSGKLPQLKSKMLTKKGLKPKRFVEFEEIYRKGEELPATIPVEGSQKNKKKIEKKLKGLETKFMLEKRKNQEKERARRYINKGKKEIGKMLKENRKRFYKALKEARSEKKEYRKLIKEMKKYQPEQSEKYIEGLKGGIKYWESKEEAISKKQREFEETANSSQDNLERLEDEIAFSK